MAASKHAHLAIASWRSPGAQHNQVNTLLPFLYQTRSIQQSVSVSPRRYPNAQRKSIHDFRVREHDDIPFESSRSSQKDSTESFESTSKRNDRSIPFHRQQRTTVTAKEHDAFLKLFMGARVKDKAMEDKSGEQIRPSNTVGDLELELEEILAEAVADIKGEGRIKAADKSKESAGFDSLANASSQVKPPVQHAQKAVPKPEVAKAYLARRLQDQEIENIQSMMAKANTDIELWNILDNEVFKIIQKLDLDGEKEPRPESRPSSTPPTDNSITEDEARLAAMGVIYPTLLLVAMRQLRQRFPPSSLPFAILPKVKSLGRGSYALGASTFLYNELIAMTWLTYADFQGIADILREMENGGIAFDENTLDLLDSMESESTKAKSGQFGVAVAAVWEMDRCDRGLKKLKQWRALIQSRIELEALRKARTEQERLRKAAVVDKGGYVIV